MTRCTRRGATLAMLVCSGCMTLQSYEGPKLPPDEVARISGDLRFTAGAELSVLLRQVDGRTLSLGENAVAVLPGEHSLLVDCLIRESGNTSRFDLDVDVAAGRKYQLVAEAGLGKCTSVRLEATN